MSDRNYIKKLQGALPVEERFGRFIDALNELTHAFTGVLVGSLLVTGKFSEVKPYWRVNNTYPFFKKDSKTLAYRVVHIAYWAVLVTGLVAVTT